MTVDRDVCCLGSDMAAGVEEDSVTLGTIVIDMWTLLGDKEGGALAMLVGFGGGPDTHADADTGLCSTEQLAIDYQK